MNDYCNKEFRRYFEAWGGGERATFAYIAALYGVTPCRVRRVIEEGQRRAHAGR